MPQTNPDKPTSQWEESWKKIWNSTIFRNIRFYFNIVYSVIKNIFLVLLATAVLLGLFGGGIGLGYFASLTAHETPLTQEQMKTAINNLNLVSTVYYADGSKVSDVRTDELRIITSLDQISQFAKDGIIATEDGYFYEHNGVVPKALVRALLQEILSSSDGATSGGSTLTQQLIKQQILTSEVTFKRKANEILYALRLEKYFTKDQILEAYLNVSPFGRNHNGLNISGIEEAAQGVFGVSAKDLTLPQAAYLVGMPQNPIVYTPYTNQATLKEDVSAGIERMKTVLYSMYRENKINQADYEAALAYDITKDFLPAEEATKSTQSYIYQAINRETIKIIMEKNAKEKNLTYDQIVADEELFERYYDQASIELSTAGYKVHSTIDKAIYDAMQETVAIHGEDIGPTYYDDYIDETSGETKQNMEMAQNGAVLIENSTGKVLGFIAGRDFSLNQVDHAFSTHRSPGSTIKPLVVYAPAIENNILYPASMVADTKISLLQPNGTYWEPTNYGNMISNRLMTARHALTYSYNNPTIKIFQAMLDQGIIAGEYLGKMGIKGIDESEYRNVALSIGGTVTGPSVAEQTSAFTTLANKGVHQEAYLIDRIEDYQGKVIYQHEPTPTQVFSEATAYITTDILRDVITRSTSYAIRSNLVFSTDVAGKTGTSEFEIDNWFVGYTPEVTLGSWIGYDNAYNASHAIIGSDGYGPATTRSMRNWTHIMNSIYNAKPELFTGANFVEPDTVYRDSVVAATGTKPGSVTGPSGQSLSIGGATNSDLFKTDNGPRAATYNFVVGGSSSDVALYWNAYLKAIEDQRKAAESAARSSSAASSSSATSSSSSSSSSTTNP